MKRIFITISQNLLIVFTVIFFMLSCSKDDDINPTAKDEDADVVYDWYKLIANIQLPSSPQPVLLFNQRNFGLYRREPVRIGTAGYSRSFKFIYQIISNACNA